MQHVRAKKFFGQHFLNDEDVAASIVNSLTLHRGYTRMLEIGPGMGVLTKYLLAKKEFTTQVVEIDRESVTYLKTHFPSLKDNILEKDFLEMDLDAFSAEPFAIIGNFPYNISTEILFKVFDYRHRIPEVVGMFQKEVAERISSAPGNRHYGIPSVLLQAFYDIDYLFTVDEHLFTPPPRVKSAVIRLRRSNTVALACDEKKFIRVVKTAFNQRRKTLRNALRPLTDNPDLPFLTLRAEQLSWKDFVELTNRIELGGDIK